MDRDSLHDYLDGQLTAEQAAAFESVLQADPQARAALEQERQRRTLRAAAMQSYAPSEGEAQQLAATWMAQFRAAEATPVGRITPGNAWQKWVAGIAACLVLSAGSFLAGRWSRPVTPTVGGAIASTQPSGGGPALATGSGPAKGAPFTVVVYNARGEAVNVEALRTYDEARSMAGSFVRTAEPAEQPPLATVGSF